ncbi:hypothetical protein GCM10011320_00650 [Neoroseomonas lacus]|uniref:Uncharacterized protein n=1 Tax=Neoroseomonas lacus TaxID=287609 RepID=A0A917NFF4_9PROT|nr:hypothetical protein GCM10011320_00650 [Neoroseomonas lacus]
MRAVSGWRLASRGAGRAGRGKRFGDAARLIDERDQTNMGAVGLIALARFGGGVFDGSGIDRAVVAPIAGRRSFLRHGTGRVADVAPIRASAAA